MLAFLFIRLYTSYFSISYSINIRKLIKHHKNIPFSYINDVFYKIFVVKSPDLSGYRLVTTFDMSKLLESHKSITTARKLLNGYYRTGRDKPGSTMWGDMDDQLAIRILLHVFLRSEAQAERIRKKASGRSPTIKLMYGQLQKNKTDVLQQRVHDSTSTIVRRYPDTKNTAIVYYRFFFSL